MSAITETTTTRSDRMAFIDIGANLLDDCFQGRYNGGKQKHDPDLDAVLGRANAAGVEKVGYFCLVLSTVHALCP